MLQAMFQQLGLPFQCDDFDISLCIITCFDNSIQTQAPRLLRGKPWFCKEGPCSISFPSEQNSSMDVFVVKY